MAIMRLVHAEVHEEKSKGRRVTGQASDEKNSLVASR